MGRPFLLLSLLVLLVACASPVVPDAAGPTGTAMTTTPDALAPAPTLTRAATAITPALAETPAPAHTAALTPTPGPSGFIPPGSPLQGFTDGLVLAAADGSLIVYYPGRGEVETLLGPGQYPIVGDYFLIPIIWPVRFSPDGQWAVIPRPAGDTWLVGPDGARQLHDQRLFATWAPDSRRIAFVAGNGLFETSPQGNVFVQEVVAGTEAQSLARLPGRADWPLWSPGCADPAVGDCGQSVVVSASAEGIITLWLIDVATAEVATAKPRELGRFRPPPIDGTLFHAWSADGAAVIGQAEGGYVAFPLDGSGPRPLVTEQSLDTRGLHSPDGSLYARLERDSQSRSSLLIGRTDTGEETPAAVQWEQAESFSWSSDGRYVLVSNYNACQDGGDACYEVWAVDAVNFPDLGAPVLLAEVQAYLGALPALLARGTEVDGRPWAETALVGNGLPGPVDGWQRHEWGEGLPAFRAPAGWRVAVEGDTFLVANYEALSDGLVALSEEQLRINGYWSDFGNAGSPFDYANLAAMRETYFNWTVEPITVNGVTGVVLRDPVAPVCERVLLPHGRGELGITYCPAMEAWREVVEAFLMGMELEE